MNNQAKKIIEGEINDAVARVIRGDSFSYERIVRVYERPIRAWLATHAPPAVDVDEMAQRTFVVAFSKLSDYAIGTNFSGWLFAIAKYELKAELTRMRRVADYHAKFAPAFLERELQVRSDESDLLQQQRLVYLAECMKLISEHVHQYLVWRYEEEIPLAEMARRSGRSISAVKKQLWNLRRGLHDCIQARVAADGGGA